MNKYTFVVLRSQHEDFLRSLQDLGMVDVTTTGWELSEEDRRLMSGIDLHREAVSYLRRLSSAGDFVPGEAYGTGAGAFTKYEAARKETARLEAEIARYEKMASDVHPWGDYDPEAMARLSEHGVVVRYFTTYSSEFEKRRGEWGDGRILEQVGSDRGTTYFVAVSTPDDDVRIDAQEVKLPAESLSAIEVKTAELRRELRDWDKVYAGAAATVDAIEAEGESLKDSLHFRQAAVSGEHAAGGSLVVMEAWAREKQEADVDAMLEEFPGVIYIKERPTPDDETPVELKNSRFASPFEFIGNLYAKPKYGTMDLTRWLAPFFMLFFGMCMGDLGYGTLIFLGGLGVTLANKKETIKQLGRLTMWCGGAAIVVGFFMGGLFGTSLADRQVFAPVSNIFIGSDTMFYLAIAIGIFQVMFAMVLNIVTTSRAFGIKNALSSMGWLWVLITCITAFGLQYLEVGGFNEGGKFAPGSIPFWVCFGAGMVLLFFFNSPGKNPLINFVGGIWGLFNRLMGLLGDALSYIRLFAIGLSGGVLALVFNRIAFEISPDIPVVGQFFTLIILLFGHGLNLFMSTLSAIVHPLRLTFVEFFNNAGFEPTEREFTPLKHVAKDKK